MLSQNRKMMKVKGKPKIGNTNNCYTASVSPDSKSPQVAFRRLSSYIVGVATQMFAISAEGGIRATSFADVRGYPSRGFWRGFAFTHVWGCSLLVFGVPVSIPVKVNRRILCRQMGSKRGGLGLHS